MNNFLPFLLLMSLMNNDGLSSIKSMIDKADDFTKRISSMSNMFTMLPGVMNTINSMNNAPQQSMQSYVDTLQEAVKQASGAKRDF